MNKIVITGCSCCFKGSVITEIAKDNWLNVIPVYSDSDTIREMIDKKLINWDFIPRLNMRYYQLSQLPMVSDHNYFIERSLIDQLAFAHITKSGWYDRDNLNDEDEAIKNEDLYLKLERNLDIDYYILIKMRDRAFVSSIIKSDGFGDSKRADSYYTVDDYFKLQDMFIEQYRRMTKSKRLKLLEIETEEHNDCIQDIINDLTNKVFKILDEN